MNPKLLITTDCFLPRWDGIARFLNEIIPRLREKYDITVVAPLFPGLAPHFKRVNIIRIPLGIFKVGDFPSAKFSNKIKKFVKDTDIVFNQTIGSIGMKAIKYAKKYKKPIISYNHSIEWELVSKSISTYKPILSLLAKIVARQLYNKCTLLLTPSYEISTIMQKEGIYTKKKIIHLGVNTKQFHAPSSKSNAKLKLKISPDKIVIGFSGRIGREKDLPTLIRAFERLQKRHKNIILLIVGSGVTDYKQAIAKNKSIITVGSKDNVVPYLQAMDVFVLPSLTETSSLATMEAMACALPVVVTPVGYIKEYLQNNANGMLFPRGESSVLAQKLEKLIKNEKLRARLGANARKTMLKYDWDKTAKEIDKVLREFVR